MDLIQALNELNNGRKVKVVSTDGGYEIRYMIRHGEMLMSAGGMEWRPVRSTEGLTRVMAQLMFGNPVPCDTDWDCTYDHSFFQAMAAVDEGREATNRACRRTVYFKDGGDLCHREISDPKGFVRVRGASLRPEEVASTWRILPKEEDRPCCRPKCRPGHKEVR